MSNPSASIFPNHKYDFGDSVFVPALQVTGTIEGIRHYPERNTWRYLLATQPNPTDTWWLEDQLEPIHSRKNFEDDRPDPFHS